MHTKPMTMNYCDCCGHPVVLKTPPGDHLPRYVCEHCGTIHYQNPRLVVGCVAQWQDKVLLCKRAIEPRAGFWTLPAGFLENDETVEQGALRETREEALAEAEIIAPLALVNVPHVHQVHLFFRAQLIAGRHGTGAESLDTSLIEEGSIPWPEIAFPSVRYALEAFFADRRRGHFEFHVSTWRKPAPA
jgi:ADP-ribose pyrophosphatase YjhB (NUDIX family)